MLRWTFSEAQAGKGPADRAAAWVKRHIRIYVNENHACRTPAEFIQATGSHGGIRGVTTVSGDF